MPTIIRVDTVGGDMLDIQLDNGNIILLAIERLLRMPRFAQLGEDDRVFYPHTDGQSLYWRDSPRLTVAELKQLVFEKN